MLEVQNLRRSFGGVYAVDGVSLSVPEGAVHAVIGPNGAGKSTLFNLVIGQLPLEEGEVHFNGAQIDRLGPAKRASLGIAIVFQGARIFRGMTVRENVMVGAHTWTKTGVWGSILRTRRFHHEERAISEAASAAIEDVGLTEFAEVDAASLPLGHQRRLQVARALCSKPRLLMLDEPASGLRADERRALAELIGRLNHAGMTFMLVEHDVAFVTRVAGSMTVMDLGQVIAEGPPAEVFRNPQVIAAYIGKEVRDDQG